MNTICVTRHETPTQYCTVFCLLHWGRVHSEKHNVTVWRPSVCPVGILTVTQQGQYATRPAYIRPNNKDDRHACYLRTIATNMYCLVNFWNVDSEVPPGMNALLCISPVPPSLVLDFCALVLLCAFASGMAGEQLPRALALLTQQSLVTRTHQEMR